jgi:2,3-bisphosphoglycerate-independent phosphoglycerate mutase
MQSTFLIILDGWGYGKRKAADAIQHAQTPYFNSLIEQYPHATLSTSGMDVGLPEGQMGNSEVGHMNIGAGRIVYQNLARINKSIQDKELENNPVLKEALNKAKEKGALHLMGLVSDGGVHAHIQHLVALCQIAEKHQVPKVWIHAFTDGRDTDPKSGKGFLIDLEKHIPSNATVASIIGRYYAMDRDKRWERVKVAYDALVHGQGTAFQQATEAIQLQYNKGITDEFLEAHILESQAEASRIKENDVVICFNFRTDRGREITEVLTQNAYHEYNMHPLNLEYYTMTQYDANFKKVKALFHTDDLTETLGEVLEKNQKSQTRIAETEKYPHVTSHFNSFT